MKFASPRGRVLVAGAVVVALGLAILVLIAPSLYEVEDKGRGPPIVPYDSGVVYKVRVLDTFTLYAPKEARPDADKVTALGLGGAATMCLITALLLGAAGGDARLRRFYGFAAAGLALLTFDESFALHESIGHNLQFLADVPGVERPDDLIFSLYAVGLAIFAWQFRDVLLANRRSVRLFAVGTVLFLIAVVGDLAGTGIDEPAEALAAICLFAGLIIMTAETLRRELRLDALAAERGVEAPVEARRRAFGALRQAAADAALVGEGRQAPGAVAHDAAQLARLARVRGCDVAPLAGIAAAVEEVRATAAVEAVHAAQRSVRT